MYDVFPLSTISLFVVEIDTTCFILFIWVYFINEWKLIHSQEMISLENQIVRMYKCFLTVNRGQQHSEQFYKWIKVQNLYKVCIHIHALKYAHPKYVSRFFLCVWTKRKRVDGLFENLDLISFPFGNGIK